MLATVNKRAVPALTAYAMMRILSFAYNPQIYLWWHGLIDLGFVAVLLLCDRLVEKEAV